MESPIYAHITTATIGKLTPDDKYEKCVIKKGGKVIKNYGYMDAKQYNTAKNSYRYRSTVKFVKNTSANRRKI